MENLKIFLNDFILGAILLTCFIVTGIALGFFASLLSFYVGIGWTIVILIVSFFLLGIFLSKKFDYTKL